MVSHSFKGTTPIKKVEFMRGIRGDDSILGDPRPHIAFVGRSNVGKSSTINTLLGRTIARESKKPGKTREINFYLVNDNLYFVDLPGYGYAKISAKDAEKLRKHMIWYLSNPDVTPRFVVMIIDIKAGVTDLDRDMLDILAHEGHRTLVLANKADKLNQKETHAQLKEIELELSEYNIEHMLVPFSAQTGKGKEKVLQVLFEN